VKLKDARPSLFHRPPRSATGRMPASGPGYGGPSYRWFCCTCSFAMLLSTLDQMSREEMPSCREHRTDPFLASE
jgi:hypothetical protein